MTAPKRTTAAKAPAAARKAPAKKVEAPEPPPDVEEQRERRAEIIAEANEAALERQKDELASAKEEDAPFVPKLDDEGAREQQEASLEANRSADKKLADEGLEGPPVVAPVLEKAEGKIEIVRRETTDENKRAKDDQFRMQELSNVWVQGTGFPQGEVIVDVRRPDVGDHARYSTWVGNADGAWALPLPGIQGPGTWLVHAEHLVTTVGEGREDHLPLILETKAIEFEVTA